MSNTTKLIIIVLFSLFWVVLLGVQGIGPMVAGMELFSLGMIFSMLLDERIDK